MRKKIADFSLDSLERSCDFCQLLLRFLQTFACVLKLSSKCCLCFLCFLDRV